MSAPSRIALIGERDPASPGHRGIEASFALYAQETGRAVAYDWVPSSTITAESLPDLFRDTAALWCTPGSPYASTEGALLAIHFARIRNLPFLATCGGFQHALMEFAENVLGHGSAHQETEPAAKDPLISQLSCSLSGGATGQIIATNPALFADILGARESTEEFNCNYGLNMNLAGIFAGSDLHFVAHDADGQVRAFRVVTHPFFVGTLFQPERRALKGDLHPVVRAFCAAST